MKTLDDIAKQAYKLQSKLQKDKNEKDILNLIELLKSVLNIKASKKDINCNNKEEPIYNKDSPHYDKIDKLSIKLDESYNAKLMATLTVNGAKYTVNFNTIIELNDFIQKTLVNHS